MNFLRALSQNAKVKAVRRKIAKMTAERKKLSREYKAAVKQASIQLRKKKRK